MENLLVVKLGGGEGLDIPRACRDLADIAHTRPLIIIHGVSARMNQMCRDMDVPVRTLISPGGHSSRYTDERTRDVFVAASHSVNQDICEWLYSYNVNALGFTENVVIEGNRKGAIRAVVDGRVRIVRDDYTGSITGVTSERLIQALEQGYVPVLPPLAISEDGLLNIDGDRAAAAVAAKLQAETLVILSNIEGLYRDYENDDAPVAEIMNNHIEQAMEWAQGRMKRKVLGAQEALEGGVQRVIIGDGRINNPITTALNGAGTHFLNARYTVEA